MEEWLGRDLPADYKEFVDGYGDALIYGHLFVPHPEGTDPLLAFMQEERNSFREAYGELRNIPQELTAIWDDIAPWAYHDWNGDMCLLFPGADRQEWRVAVAFRQCPEFLLLDGGVTEFLEKILGEQKLPREWPAREPKWQSMPDSPVM
ncbi:hypothetical protein OG426_33200 [Streptomyces canus]|uniref:hypothetical protein n=1 Tax=Streptomyces canus TaxID=58343 RepID=UPI0022530C0B|nr:hypothetical protein [Streptomyces canus]MCX4857706.1 hypothetical protein [Streptomyces canus]WSW36959.1 hypothetical protein OG426_33200 [Streptomyces canus]